MILATVTARSPLGPIFAVRSTGRALGSAWSPVMLTELALVGRSIPGRDRSDQRPLARSIVGWLTPCRNKPVAIITSTTPGAGNVGPSCRSTEYPLCSMCLARNVATPATVADHITPHHGDHQLFYFGELQSLCQHCHSSRKKQLETYGYQRDVGVDGWPIDPNHPANKSRP